MVRDEASALKSLSADRITTQPFGVYMESLLRDGIKLAYEQRGNSEHAMVFVHGWCCDHTFFEPQLNYFSPSRRVISMDLRGHGESDKPYQTYHPDVLADDIAWMLRKMNLNNPIVVGHSMGGVIALRLAYLYPGSLSALVGLDSGWAMLPELAALGPMPLTMS
jgi:pimeloyl-ACP methyl ester carboxylesterase